MHRGMVWAWVLAGLLILSSVAYSASGWYTSLVFAVSYDHPASEGLDYASITFVGEGPNQSIVVAGEYSLYEPYASTDAYIALISEYGVDIVATVRGDFDDRPLAAWYENGALVVAGISDSWDREYDPPEWEGFIARVVGAQAIVYSYDPAYPRSEISLMAYEPGKGVVFAGSAGGPVVVVPQDDGGVCWVQKSPFATAVEEPGALDYDGYRVLLAGLARFTYGTLEYMFYGVYTKAGGIEALVYLEPAEAKTIRPESAALGSGIVVGGKTDSYPGDYRGLDAFILYALPGGGVQWAYTFGGPGHDSVPLVEVNGSRVIAVSYLDMESYGLILLLTFNATGALEWATVVNSTWANTTLQPTALEVDGDKILLAIPYEVRWQLRQERHVETLLLSITPGENKTISLAPPCPLELCGSTITITSYKSLDPLGLSLNPLLYSRVNPPAKPSTEQCTLNVRQFTTDALRVDLIASLQVEAPPPTTTTPPPEETLTTTTTTETTETTTTTTGRTTTTVTTETVTTATETTTTVGDTTIPTGTETTTTTTTTPGGPGQPQPEDQQATTQGQQAEEGRFRSILAAAVIIVVVLSATALFIRRRSYPTTF